MDSTTGDHRSGSEYEDEEEALRKFTEVTGGESFDDQMARAIDRAAEKENKKEESADPPKKGRGRPPKKRGRRPVSRFPSEEKEDDKGLPPPIDPPSAFPRPQGMEPPPRPALSDMTPPQADDVGGSDEPRSPELDIYPMTEIPADDGHEYGIGQTAASGISSTHGEVLGAEMKDMKRQMLAVQNWQQAVEGRMREVETTVRSLEGSMTQQSTAILDRFRTIERTFEHDPTMTASAARLAHDASRQEIQKGIQPSDDRGSQLPPKKRGVSFLEAVQLAKRGKR